MSDTKITGLATASSLAAADLFAIADDPAGAVASRSIRADAIRTYTSTFYDTTAAETAASVTPTDKSYPPGDVRRYGTNTTPGTTDMTTAIINAGKSSLNVYLHPDTYLITGSLATGIQSGQRWYGGGTIITSNGFDHPVFAITTKTDVVIDRIHGASGTLGVAYGSANARFFDATSSSHRCKMLHCKVTGFQSAARVNASEHCEIIDNDIITPYGWGVNVQTDADDTVVAHNRINGAVNEHGIYASGSSGNRIRSPHIHNNTVTGCAVDGIKVTHADDSHVHDNTSYSNTGQGVYVTIGVNRANVHDNHSYSNGEQGIIVFTSTASDTMDKNHVHDNICYLNGGDGIRVQVSNASAVVSNTVVAHNIVDDNNQDAGSFRGISISFGSGTLSDTIIESNRVTNETTAINISASCTGTVIRTNTFAGNTTNISDSGTLTVIDQVTRGATSVADGGTVSHGHVKTPTSVRVTPSTTGEFVSVTAIGATTFTVAIKKHDNTAGTTQTVYWDVAG